MRIRGVDLVLVGVTAALAAQASAQQPRAPDDPVAPGPMPPSTTAAWPPASSGCGEDGPSTSDRRPTVRLTSGTLRLRYTGHVRIYLRGNQTAAMTVTIAQVGGKRVGGTTAGTYTCTTPRKGLVSLPLDTYGRKLVRRYGRLAVKLTFRLINGSGVRNKRVLSGVIKPE